MVTEPGDLRSARLLGYNYRLVLTAFTANFSAVSLFVAQYFTQLVGL